MVDIGFISIFPFRVVLLFCIIYNLMLSAKVPFNTAKIKTKAILCFFTFWAYYSMFSVLWSVDKVSSIKYNIFLLSGIFIIYIIVNTFVTVDDYKAVTTIWVYASTVVVAWGLWNNLNGFNLINLELLNIEQSSALKGTYFYPPKGPYNNQNEYATMLSMSLPIMISFYALTKNNIKKLFVILLFLTSIYLIAMTYSRANVLALLLGLTVSLIIYAKLKLHIRSILAITASAVVTGFVFNEKALYAYNLVINSLQSMVSSLYYNEYLEGSSIDIRYNLIKNGISFIKDSYGFGVGAGNAEYYMLHNYIYSTQGVINPHSWVVEIAINYGFLVAVYFGVYLTILFYLFKQSLQTSNLVLANLSKSYFISLIIFLVGSFSSSSVVNFIPGWLIIALSIGLINVFRIYQSGNRELNSSSIS